MDKIRIDGFEIYSINNFLSDSECDALKAFMDANNYKSAVTGTEQGKASVYSEARTSLSSSLSRVTIPIIKDIDERIEIVTDISKANGEEMQGQLYKVGQEFKPHYDAFDKKSLELHYPEWGNRTHTFLIYINDDFEGGETEFPNAKLKITPIKGLALFWENLDSDKNQLPISMHAGLPVTSGSKYIMTKWLRENKTNLY